MKTNFKIISSTELVYQEHLIDLHNNFRFSHFNYNIKERIFSIHLIKSIGDWLKDYELDNIAFIHKNVAYLNIHYINPLEYPQDDQTLDFISYFPVQDRNINNGFITKSTPDEDDDILYYFQNEQFIRINCEEIEMLTF